MVETRSTKRMKKTQTAREDGEGTGDRLSEFPDHVLHKILSYLPMDQAARTSVLSKRWADLWLCYPELDFNSLGTFQIGVRWECEAERVYGWHHQFCKRSTKQADSIPGMMGSRVRLMSSVRGCAAEELGSLRLKALMSPKALTGLIGSVARLRVRELDLEVSMMENLKFPNRLARIETLRVLKMHAHLYLMSPRTRLDDDLSLTKGFRSLKVLQISGFKSVSLVLLDNVTENSFTSLQTLHISRCTVLEWIVVRCSSLRDFKLEDCPRVISLEVDCENLQEMTVLSCMNRSEKSVWLSCVVSLRTPKLIKLLWSHNGLTRRSRLEKMECLMDACVDGLESCYDSLRVSEGEKSLGEFVARLSHARSLSLGRHGVKALASLSGSTGLAPRPFINLLKLALQSTGPITAIPTILKSTPLLEDLSLLHDSVMDNESTSLAPSRWLAEEKKWESCCFSYEAFLHNLKSVSLVGRSRGNLVGTAMFLLKHVVSLREMEFSLKFSCLGEISLLEQMMSEIRSLASTSGINIHFRDAPTTPSMGDFNDEIDMAYMSDFFSDEDTWSEFLDED